MWLPWPFNEAVNVPDLDGKVFIVTGSSSGVGLETAKALAAQDATVVLANRDREETYRAINDITQCNKGAKGKLIFLECDLTSFRSIADFVAAFKARNLPLHGLLNNAGVENPPDHTTPDGFDVTLATNYFGAFYLTHLLLDKLTASVPSRVVFTSSLSEGHGWVAWDDLRGTRNTSSDYVKYAESKLELIMLVSELQRRLRRTGVDVFAAHPGVCGTEGFRKSDKSKAGAIALQLGAHLIAQSPPRGALSIIKCAADPALQGQGGADKHWGCYYATLPYKYFWISAFCTNVFNTSWRRPQNSLAHNHFACERLYSETLRVVNEAASAAKLPHVMTSEVYAGEQ